MRFKRILLTFFVGAIIVSCGSPKSELDKSCMANKEIKNFLLNADEKTGSSGQIIIITSSSDNPEYVNLYTVEKNNGTWHEKFGKIKATIGKNGFADKGMKKEGDGKTPSGVFKLGTAFGYSEKINTKLPYRQSTENDFWIDDVNSDKYNTWVSGKPEAKSFERMKRKDHLYKYGIVVEYNTDPVVKGKGSAIFLHVWRAPGKKTAGCAAMDENDILKILEWLDPEKEPLVMMGNSLKV